MRLSRIGRRSLLAATLTALLVPAQASAVSFTSVEGFATKTGFRGVIAWQADAPVQGIVRYGSSATNLNKTALPLANAVDRAQLAIVDGLTIGQPVHYRIDDRVSGAQSPVQSFVARNAFGSSSSPPTSLPYTINALLQLDSEALPDGVPFDQGVRDLAKGIDVLAERIHDATDGAVRLGTVLVTDTTLGYPANVPFGPQATFGGPLGDRIRRAGCAGNVNDVGAVGHTLADFLVQTSIPFDSHTFSGFMIADPCTAFYIGREGQLVVPWEDDLHLGYTMAHEFAHYAFNAPDLYPLNSDADCRNLSWDGSLMHNTGGWTGSRWELTELDRNATATPCDHGSEPYSWDVLRSAYTLVPANPGGPVPDGHVQTTARGNPDGGALAIFVLDHEPGSSQLTAYP